MKKIKLNDLTRKKEFYLGLLLSVLILIIVFAINFSIIYSDNQKETIKKIDMVTDSVENNISRTLRTIDNVSKNVFLSESFQSNVDGLLDENTNDVSIEGISSIFENALNGYDSLLIKDICYIPRDHAGELDIDNFIHSGYSSNLFNNKSDANLENIINESLLEENVNGALFLNELSYFGAKSDQICFSRNIYSLRNHNYNEKMGIGIIVVNKQRLLGLLEYSNVIDGFTICLNYNDKIYFSSSEEEINYENESGILKTISFGFYNWKIITYYNSDYFLLSFKSTFFYSILIMIVILIIYSMLYYLFHRKNLKSIYYLFDNFHKIKNDNQLYKIDYIDDDEINRVIMAYNEMVESVNALNHSMLQEKDKVLHYQLQKKDFEIRSLYAQINKHFIINVLSIIHSLINLNQINNANYCLENLSDFLRYSLTLDSNSYLKDELNNVKSYFNIQSIRYSKVSYKLEYDDNIEDIKVPKLIIQPLIENAYVHGLKNKTGNIEVVVKKENNTIVILIIDDGIGLTSDEIKIINEKISLCEEIESKTETSHGIALTNIQKRLNLMYGSRGKLKLDKMNGKTVSSITIEME